ncbi:MAG: PEP-CTERM sorting domain-containing protein [Pirellulales bacterium]|nr:PEP-CTERM sorting domain-containing protein [Pirellulales bacterium]
MKSSTWIRNLAAQLGVAAAAMIAPDLQAATIFWQGTGVSGNLTDPNYSDGTNTNLSPTAADVVNFGGGGTATHSVAGATSFSKLRVGHAEAPGGSGTGNVTVNGGAQINLTGGASGSANAGLWVGNAQNGTLTIDGAGSSVTSNQLIVIGYAANQPTRNGTIHLTNGGALISSAGNINLGDSPSAGQNGIQGHLFVNGTVSAMGAGADMNIGIRNATSSVTQTGGAINIADVIEVGFGGAGTHTNLNSSFTISGGTTTHGGNFFVGRGASAGATVNISGGTINTGGRFLAGAGTATGVVVNHSGGTLNIANDLRVADSGSSNSTYNLSGAGVLNSTNGGIVGRQGTAAFYQTGGTANFNAALSIGNREAAANAASGLYEISAGDLNVATALNVAPNGTGEFRVVGDDATIDVTGAMLVDNTANGVGALAFELESGDLLSMINVTGVATFNLGASLIFDVSNAAPTQGVYDLLTAASIVDNGIAFSGPAPWSYRIISGGNGQILQVIVPEPGAFGLVLIAGAMLLWRRR